MSESVSPPTRAEYVIDAWKHMYVDGRWTLEEFEAHVAAMLPVIPAEWWSQPQWGARRGFWGSSRATPYPAA
jgi:hypothetical protein